MYMYVAVHVYRSAALHQLTGNITRDTQEAWLQSDVKSSGNSPTMYPLVKQHGVTKQTMSFTFDSQHSHQSCTILPTRLSQGGP